MGTQAAHPPPLLALARKCFQVEISFGESEICCFAVSSYLCFHPTMVTADNQMMQREEMEIDSMYRFEIC